MCACTPLPAEGEAPGGYVLVFDDITAMLQAQREAAWGEVARRLAHEIKNPLTPIQLSAERMRHAAAGDDRPKDAQMLDRATQTIVQQVEAMKEMVNAFSEYARAPRLRWRRVNLNQLVTEVTDLYRAQDAVRGVRLKVDLDERLDAVVADRGRLRQLLNNLITNALEALEGQADGVDRRRDAARCGRGETKSRAIIVEDNGPGFQRELIGQVFEPYVTSKAKGTGLGLAIVKKIVEEHGGHIEADNRAEGGAQVASMLPLSEAAAGPRAGAAGRSQGENAHEPTRGFSSWTTRPTSANCCRKSCRRKATRSRPRRERRARRAPPARSRRPTWCCSTSGCPTPTASPCCGNGRSAVARRRRSS